MLGDLLVDWDFKLIETGPDAGKIDTDLNGDPILIEKAQVFPIHKDDELILYQMPGKSYGGNQGLEFGGATELQCLCCYGHADFTPQRTTKIRQKYKYIGCSWTWYPPKFTFNYDQNIPQCGIAAGVNTDPLQIDYKLSCYDYTSLGLEALEAGNGEGQGRACNICTQINPFLINTNLIDQLGKNIFDVWGNKLAGADPTVRDTQQSISPMGSGWLTQYASTLYPGDRIKNGYECCTCKFLNITNSSTIPPDSNTSCWRTTQNTEIAGQCSNINAVKQFENILSENGGYFYSTFENRINDFKGSAQIKTNQVFTIGNIEGSTPLYLINSNISSGLYTPSKGGYSQNDCTFCSLSPYLRELAHNQYPWAFDIFCAGGSLSSSAKTYNFPTSFIKTGFIADLGQPNDWYLETIAQGRTSIPVPIEDYEEVLGEHTFYSQFVGMVQLEHYWHYTGVHKDDIEAARNTLPPSIDPTDDPKERWDYWKQRTTPKIFTFKSSATPLFTFDLVYADRIGILQKFTDPDITAIDQTGGRARMTVKKFLSYYSQFSNGYRNNIGTQPIDGRGRAIFPTGCETPGYQFVRVIKDILDAMCEANIIGTRDHRPVIYNEIKQIIESGIANGRNGAYYKPWAPGNPIFVTPSDFDKLKSKYYDSYGGKMCTEKEMFPEDGLKGLGNFAPIRKVIPPSILDLGATDNGTERLKWDEGDWNNNVGSVPSQPPLIYKANTFNPDEIFNEGRRFTRLCSDGTIDFPLTSSLYPEKKIQNLQFSKYYANGFYNTDSPDYVNSQLFFRAIPGRWSFVKWAPLVNFGDWCNRSNPCSPYEIYGDPSMPINTGSPDYLWHSEDVRTTLFTDDDTRYAGGFYGMCNGVNPTDDAGPNEDETLCRNANAAVNRGAALYCAFKALAWDPSGNPSKAYCTPVCPQQTTECINFPCGARCGGYQACADANIRVNGNIDWDVKKTCAQLFGRSCCECIGKDPDVNLTVRDWIFELVDNRKCESCADQCNFSCPIDDGSPAFTSINGDGGIGGGSNFSGSSSKTYYGDDRFYNFGIGGGPGGGGGGGGGGGNNGGCDCPNLECVTIGYTPCDTNCGYNGFSYTPLSFVMSQSNYGWVKRTTTPDPDNDVVTTCSLCSCRSTNYCYVRFAGKILKYLPNPQTGFYEPTENPTGELYDNDLLNLEVPAHYLSPLSNAGRVATTIISCGNNCTQPGSNDNFDCICRNSSLSTMMCAGAVVKQSLETRNASGQCNTTALWCGFYRSGRLILNKVVSSDIIDSNYEY